MIFRAGWLQGFRSRPPPSREFLSPPRARVPGVAEGVADEVEGEQGQRQHRP